MCAKFAGQTARTRVRGPVATAGPATTYEGGTGGKLDLKSELFSLVLSDFAGEATFYESGAQRLDRLEQLAAKATAEDPAWVAGLTRWVRDEANMRSVAVVLACTYVEAGGPGGRKVIDSACVRADEPAEILGYWLSTYGKPIPAAVKRGVADAAVRLYTERAALKYDGGSRGVRMGDVIELVRPKPKAEWQSQLFRYLLDRRHGREDARTGSELDVITRARSLDTLPNTLRRLTVRELGPQALADAGFTWERLAGWLPDGMDAEAWEAIIPSMGYMALLRNLRNFEKANVSPEVLTQVERKLIDPEEIARSRQLPFRFWSAWKNSGTMRFGPALELALDRSLANVPQFGGRTLVAVDVSGSMNASVSKRSDIMRWEVGAVFAAAIAGKSETTLVAYGTDSVQITDNAPVSVLRCVEQIRRWVRSGELGYGTNTWTAVAGHFKNHDRVLIFTDGQAADSLDWYTGRVDAQLQKVPIYTWDLGGYAQTHIELGGLRHQFGGFSDRTFELLAILENRQGGNAPWPWEG